MTSQLTIQPTMEPKARTDGAFTTVRRTVAAELVKLRTLRSYVWLLGVATTFTIVLGPIQTLGQIPDDSGPVGSGEAVFLALTGTTTATVPP